MTQEEAQKVLAAVTLTEAEYAAYQDVLAILHKQPASEVLNILPLVIQVVTDGFCAQITGAEQVPTQEQMEQDLQGLLALIEAVCKAKCRVYGYTLEEPGA